MPAAVGVSPTRVIVRNVVDGGEDRQCSVLVVGVDPEQGSVIALPVSSHPDPLAAEGFLKPCELGVVRPLA